MPQAPALAGPRATVDDAHADFIAGDFPACMRKTSALLSSNGVKRDSPERYDLLMMRGECLLRLKQRPAAAEAFEAAAAVMKNRRDLPRVASATSLAVLVKASPDLTYRSKKHASSSGIDIVEPSTRGEAMTALFDDLSAKVAPAIDKALLDKSLVSTEKLLREVWELYTVEFAATGDTVATAAKLKELGAHVRALVGDELDRLTTRLEQLRDLAAEPTWVTQAISYRGLNSNERTELRQMADYLMQIQRTVENGRRISRALGTTGETWETLLADCAVARDVAEQAHDRRY
jgi:hypothetical protein